MQVKFEAPKFFNFSGPEATASLAMPQGRSGPVSATTAVQICADQSRVVKNLSQLVDATFQLITES